MADTTKNGKTRGFWGNVKQRVMNFGQLTDRPTGDQIAAEGAVLGEDTGDQSGGGGARVTGFGCPANAGTPQAGTFRLYRQMRKNPTIAIARMVVTVMLKGAQWTYEKKDKDVPDEWKELVQNTFNPLRRRFMDDVVRSLDNGFAPFEKVWVMDEGRIKLNKLKPLLVDKTKILVDKNTGGFEGLKNKAGKEDVILPRNKSFLFTYDGEAGNLHGRSRMENVKKPWAKWEEVFERESKYLAMSASPVPFVSYPIGESLDVNGSKVDNSEIAAAILMNIQRGLGVTMPKQWVPWAAELLKNGAKPDELMAWTITWLEPKSARGKEFLDALRHQERLMLRGWLAPERTVTEGQHGTNAESESQTDIVILSSQDLMDDIMECVNDDPVNQLLVLNFGAEAKGAVKAVAAPLVDATLVFLQEVVKSVVSGQAGLEFMSILVDQQALAGRVGLPANESGMAGDLFDALVNRQTTNPMPMPE